MTTWTDVANETTFPINTWRIVETDDICVAVFHLDDGFYAIEDICTHDGEILTGGPIEGNEIVCPRHGARFCIKTGAVTAPPAYEDVETFPVRIKDGMVQVQL